MKTFLSDLSLKIRRNALNSQHLLLMLTGILILLPLGISIAHYRCFANKNVESVHKTGTTIMNSIR